MPRRSQRHARGRSRHEGAALRHHCQCLLHAGRKVYPHHDVYGGTKHFVHAVSEGMRQTMSSYRVRVMVISPGVAKSEIDKTITHQDAYDFWDSGRKQLDGGLDANDIARTMLFAYELPQDVNLQEMTITHTGQEF
nr:SDR family NAD(P)-dependent oxidoreductase [Sinorhizobium meliloti]